MKTEPNALFRCLWCKTPMPGNALRVRRDLPLGSPCPSCGKGLILEPIPEEGHTQ